MEAKVAGATQLFEEAYKVFLAPYPEYAKTGVLDELRSTAYRRLDEQQVYLDHAGGSLYAESQLDEHLALLRSGAFGNSHSTNPTSTAMTEHVELTRRFVLQFFGARTDDYVLVFTQNASGA